MSPAKPLSPTRRSLAFFTLIIALVLEIVDTTIVNTALPSIERSFGTAGAAAQWIAAGYALAFATLLLAGGRLGDIFGPRAMFLAGVAGFTLASLACGLAPGSRTLIAARVAQGAAGAVMAPQVLAMIQQLYDPVERIGRLAWFGVIGGLSAIAGPLLGGLLIAANLFGSGWRAVFLINLPVGLVALVAGWLLLPQTVRHADRRFDWGGLALFATALAAVLGPLVHGEQGGPSVLTTLVTLVPGLALLGLGVWWLHWRARRGQAVLFDPALFANALFRDGAAFILVFSAANMGFLFVFGYALQALAGFSPLGSGLIHIPFSAGVMAGMALIGRRFATRAEKWLLVGGALGLAVSLTAVLGWIALGHLPLVLLFPPLLTAGAAMGSAMGPATPLAMARVDRQQAGSASGIVKTMQQAGAAFGIALAGGAFFAAGAGHSLWPATATLVGLLVLSAGLALRLPRGVFASA